MNTSTLEKTPRNKAVTGDKGQLYLAAGDDVALRMWEHSPASDGCESPARDYETVGYVISGQAELTVDGQTIQLLPGDSWVVPKDTVHSYKIISGFTAVEATSPPARCQENAED